jgi:hypothetical protein
MAYPCGLHPKSGHSALIRIHLESPNYIPCALIALIWGSSDNTAISVNRP